MTNPCTQVELLLSAYLEEETSPAETRFLEGHLTACGACREQREELALLIRQVKQLPPIRVSEDFTERVLQEALGRQPAGLDVPVYPATGNPIRSWGVPLAAAAALFVVAAIGIRGMEGEVPGNESPVSAQAAIDEREGGDSRSHPSVTTPPPRRSLADQDPLLGSVEVENDLEGLGLASESYMLEDWKLSRPTGGGDAVLTRVDAEAGDRVTVTF